VTWLINALLCKYRKAKSRRLAEKHVRKLLAEDV
jgi:hypothetical protein